MDRLADIGQTRLAHKLRLETISISDDGDNSRTFHNPVCQKAADAIDWLVAEVKRLRGIEADHDAPRTQLNQLAEARSQVQAA